MYRSSFDIDSEYKQQKLFPLDLVSSRRFLEKTCNAKPMVARMDHIGFHCERSLLSNDVRKMNVNSYTLTSPCILDTEDIFFLHNKNSGDLYKRNTRQIHAKQTVLSNLLDKCKLRTLTLVHLDWPKNIKN